MGTTNDETGVVKSVRTLFSIIESLRRLDGAGVTEIADDVGLAKSAVHKHLRTLTEEGYVIKTDTEYRIGLRFLDLGVYARDRTELHRVAEPKMQQLAKESGELSSCIVEEAGEAVFLDRVTGENSVRTNIRVGARVPLHGIAGGKAILAHLPEKRVREIIDQHGLRGRTENTITDEDDLLEELKEISNLGYAINAEEWIDGFHAVYAPILADDRVLGAIGLAGAANRLSIERCHGELSDMVLAAANEIELNITYS